MKRILYLATLFFTVCSFAQDGTTWTSQTTPVDNLWNSITYGNGLFVAVAGSGTNNRIMTSPDAITWTLRTSPADNYWTSVCYGNGKFLAVANSGTNRLMESVDGIAWTTSAIPLKSWRGITYANGKYVAVGGSGMGANGDVMYSADGITWTSSTIGFDMTWTKVKYLNNTFIAVGNGTTSSNVMKSTDGITWTIISPPLEVTSNAGWSDIEYGNGTYVIVGVAQSAVTTIKTSPDLVTWTTRKIGASNLASYKCLAFGNGTFVALRGYNFTNNNQTKVSVSTDGITWTNYDAVSYTNNVKEWNDIIYTNNIFVGVSANYYGPNNRVMTSGTFLNTESFGLLKNIKVYPNPSNGVYTIQTENDLNIEIFDITGKKIKTQKITFDATSINISEFENGIYFVKFTDGNNQSSTLKIVKN